MLVKTQTRLKALVDYSVCLWTEDLAWYLISGMMLSLSQRGFRRPYKSYTPPADLDEIFVTTCAKTLPELSTGADLSKIRLEGECKAFKLSNQKFGCKFFLQFLADFSQDKLFGSPWCWQPFSVCLRQLGTSKLNEIETIEIGAQDFPHLNTYRLSGTAPFTWKRKQETLID